MIATQLVSALLVLAPNASPDNNVEWDGVTHVAWQDRRPLCPVDGDAFDVVFQAYCFDLTSARVYVDDGTGTWVDASFDHDRGPYAVWRAEVPATASSTLSYYIELTDGTDTAYYSLSGMSEDPPTDGGFVIDYDTLEHAPLGATLLPDGGTVFKVWAPTPTSAYVRGQFNGWGTSNPMSSVGDYFITHVPSANYRQMYKYYFQPGAVWNPDARARSLNPSDNYNSHIEDPFHYTWSDHTYQTPAFEDMILYELHVGTFSGRNDPVASGSIPATYADLAAHVGHLVELGVNVVNLMPINEFSWDFSAGYNPVSVWAPEWKYGDPDDVKIMINILHAHGIAVLQDIVWNHFGPNDNYLWYYDGAQIYFDDPAVDTPWGSQADFDRPEVRDYFVDSVLYWLEEYHFDGFRMDATDYMNMYQGWGWGLMQRMNDEIDARWVDKISIAEQLPDDPWVTRPTNLGGAGFDSQWHDAFTDNLRQEILDAGWNQTWVDMWRIADVIDGSGPYLSGVNVVNYLELHDEAWPESGGQRLVKTIDSTFPHDDIYAKGRIKLGQGIVMFAQGIPMFLQGSEWLEDTGFGAGSPTGSDRIDWSKKDTYAPIFQYFKDMIRVRKTNGGFRANAGCNVYHVNESGNVLAFHRWDLEGNDLVVVVNFSDTNYTNYQLGFPQGGTWYELLNSQAGIYDGNGWGNGGSIETTATPIHGFDHSAWITIPQMGLLVFRYNDPPEPPGTGDFDFDGDTDLNDYAVFQACFAGGECPGFADLDLDNDGDVDIADYMQFHSNFAGPN